jgi:hypothetical protein
MEVLPLPFAGTVHNGGAVLVALLLAPDNDRSKAIVAFSCPWKKPREGELNAPCTGDVRDDSWLDLVVKLIADLFAEFCGSTTVKLSATEWDGTHVCCAFTDIPDGLVDSMGSVGEVKLMPRPDAMYEPMPLPLLLLERSVLE